ncbi:MAG TPA: hypothetical protein VK335_23315 [Bryobacteraceae bacterium]|nr:hypothetical protein [Bryobacteraceae bacterium]
MNTKTVLHAGNWIHSRREALSYTPDSRHLATRVKPDVRFETAESPLDNLSPGDYLSRTAIQNQGSAGLPVRGGFLHAGFHNENEAACPAVS